MNYRVPDKVMFRGPKPKTRGGRQRKKILPGRIQLLSHKTKEWEHTHTKKKKGGRGGHRSWSVKVVQVLIVKKDGKDRNEKM